MNNHIINKEQAQDIFTKICTKNQWQILMSQYRDDKEYYLKPIVMTEEEGEKHEKSTYISSKDFAKDINFFEVNPQINLRISHVDTFRFLAGFLEESNLNTMKALQFFGVNRDRDFKKWDSVLELLRNGNAQLPLDDISTVLTKYHAKISVKNYSIASGDLPDLFRILNKCKEQNSEYEFHPALSAFCANHLDQILEKPTLKTFIFSKIKDIVPDHIAYYKEFLQVQGTDKDFFSEATPQYKTFQFNKDALFKEYPLNLDSPANSDNYFALLEGAIVFLNKEKMLKKLNCNHIEFFGKQQKHDNFIVTVDAKANFNVDLFKAFVVALMSEAVSLSNNIPDCHASKLKYELKEKYETIFNHAKLDMELPPKATVSLPPRKL